MLFQTPHGSTYFAYEKIQDFLQQNYLRISLFSFFPLLKYVIWKTYYVTLYCKNMICAIELCVYLN